MNSNQFIKAVKLIYQNIDEPMTVASIAKDTGVSVSTLKRLFMDATTSSVGSFIRRIRMERAFRSLKNKKASVLEIALSSGFNDHSAFTRSFKEHFGYSPKEARNIINIVNELESITLEDPEIVEIDAFKIQAVTKQGLYFESAPAAWEALKKNLDASMLSDDFTGAFVAIGHDNPHDDKVAENQVRFSAGVSHQSTILGCEELTIDAGHYARFKYTGKLNNIGLAYHYIYGAWLHQSTIKIDPQKPSFRMMDQLPDMFEAQSISIYVPALESN